MPLSGVWPSSDGHRYIPENEYSKEIQIPALIKILGVTESFAEKLYSNWIRINPNCLNEDTLNHFKENALSRSSSVAHAILLDTWLYRGIPWPEICEKNRKNTEDEMLFLPSEPYGTGESQFTRIKSKLLLDISPEKQIHVDAKIPIWHPKNKTELLTIINEIFSRLQFSNNSYELWFRGQTREYIVERDKEVISWLGYQNSATKTVSLLPNLARLALESPNELEKFLYFGGIASRYWQRAYLIATFRKNPLWFNYKPGYLKTIEDTFLNDDLKKISEILSEIKYDPLIADEADDFRQWWFSSYNKYTLTLMCQHYGLPTSGLDITKTIDLALFFALNKYDRDEQNYKKVKIESKNPPLIYLFLKDTRYEYGDTNMISSEEFFDQSDEIKFPIPLRVTRQECGLMWGTGHTGWNYYSELILGKILLDQFESEDLSKKQSYYFPNADLDEIYDLLLRATPAVPYLMKYNSHDK